jgi:hypothetical protein
MAADSRNKRLILLELNEVNFDIVKKYLDLYPRKFKAMEKLIAGAQIKTSSEKKYEELEPWIQWVSVHTGKSYCEHKIFRLGDIVGSNESQIFEKLEDAGIRVGCLSPMNAENRLRNPAYFIPDPWTRTATDRSWWSKTLSRAVSQAVNDNSHSRITLTSAASILAGLVRFAKFRHYKTYLGLIARSCGAPWRKALALDLLLHDWHMSLFDRTQPQFSTLFLNAGAHIQHHYFFNAEPIRLQGGMRNPSWYVPPNIDPIHEMITVYDKVVGEYLNRDDLEMILATGLSQRPYDRTKFYYRLKDHAAFLTRINIKFDKTYPRMTRDFLVEFSSEAEANTAEITLRKIRVEPEGEPIFAEIDNRGKSLFVTLTYPNEITEEMRINAGDQFLALKNHVAFVAIKNGMHQEEGFAFFTPRVASVAPSNHDHVKSVHDAIANFFGANCSPNLIGT